MDKLIRTIGFLCYVFLSIDASAGSAENVHITDITFVRECTNHWNGCVYIDFDGTYSNPPDCWWAPAGNRMALDINDDAVGSGFVVQHRAMLASILSAHAAGHLVNVTGMGSCAIGGNVETLKGLVIHSN